MWLVERYANTMTLIDLPKNRSTRKTVLHRLNNYWADGRRIVFCYIQYYSWPIRPKDEKHENEKKNKKKTSALFAVSMFNVTRVLQIKLWFSDMCVWLCVCGRRRRRRRRPDVWFHANPLACVSACGSCNVTIIITIIKLMSSIVCWTLFMFHRFLLGWK